MLKCQDFAAYCEFKPSQTQSDHLHPHKATIGAVILIAVLTFLNYYALVRPFRTPAPPRSFAHTMS